MNPALLLAFALLPFSSGSAQEVTQTSGQRPPLAADTGAAKAAPELARLDQVLTLAQESKDQGRLTPERYQEFLAQFRVSLDNARAAAPPSPAAEALYARILARLGDSQQAMVALAPARQRDPQDPDLRVALGHVRFEEKDYPAAYAEAEAVLKLDPANKAALALKYFSQGRIAGTAAATTRLPPPGLEEVSVLDDPRVAEAGRRALAHQTALGLTDEAMRRLKIKDPREALRYLSMAGAIDPELPNVPMQQGLAYADLKQHAAAVERFTQAESMWRARETPRTDQLAGLAQTMREREAANLLQAQASAQSPASQPKKPATPLPYDAVGLVLIAVGVGTFLVLEKRRDEAAIREAVEVYGPAGLVVAGGALVAMTMLPPARVAGPSLRAATVLARETELIQATAAGIGAGTILMASKQDGKASNSADPTSSNSPSGTQGGTSQGEPDRDRLLKKAQDPELRDAIDKLYRKNAKIGSGSTMDGYRYESQTGTRLSKSGHGQKLVERRDQLMRVLHKPDLSPGDRQITKDILIDIQNALSGL